MILRWKTGLIVVSCVALASLWGYASRSSRGEQKANTAPAADVRGSDWSVNVRPNSNIEIWYKGVPIISSSTLFWGQKWKFAGANFKPVAGEQGHHRFVGEVRDLKLRILADMEAARPNVIQMELLVQAAEEMAGVIGGGWQWNLKLDSPALGGRVSAPELLPNDRGWTWHVGQGQAITLRFEEAAPKVYFERGQKSMIRTFLVSDRIERGSRRFGVTLELPEGAEWRPSPEERDAPVEPGKWFPGALAPDASPVDLSFLNRDDRPAGRRGFVRADGDRLVFADGTPARFWGGNLAAYAIFEAPRKDPARQDYRRVLAHQAHRMAQLGYNLMRIHHHDSDWVPNNLFGRSARSSRRLDPEALDILDWTIKCLKDEGIYVWLDMHVSRSVRPEDGVSGGGDEIARNRGLFNAFSYYNRRLQELMKEFQNQYLNHLNRYTRLRYKDDPAVIGVLISNENDLTFHGGHAMLPDKKNPFHNALWTAGYTEFARQYGLPANRVFQTWVAGPSKLYLAQAEHDFNETMIANLRQIGVQSPIATTNFWGGDPLFSLPPLTDGDLIDVHSYGVSEEFDKNAHYDGTFVDWIAMGQVYGKPLSVTEWNVPYAQTDRFVSPLYVASIASLQGWDAPMIYTYSQMFFSANPGPETWSSFHDPALTAIMPAAALLFRREHVSPARKAYCFIPGADALFGRELNPGTSATIRTLAEQSKLTVGMPEVRELPWLKPSQPSGDVTIVNDPDRDFIPSGQSFVRSDTGELTRDWQQGIHTIDTPRTQAVSGWIGGKTLRTGDATFEAMTKKAVIALTSVDNRPLAESHFILVTAVARSVASPGNRRAIPLRAGLCSDRAADQGR